MKTIILTLSLLISFVYGKSQEVITFRKMSVDGINFVKPDTNNNKIIIGTDSIYLYNYNYGYKIQSKVTNQYRFIDEKLGIRYTLLLPVQNENIIVLFLNDTFNDMKNSFFFKL